MSGVFAIALTFTSLIEGVKPYLAVLVPLSWIAFGILGILYVRGQIAENRDAARHLIPPNTFTVSCLDGMQPTFNESAWEKNLMAYDLVTCLIFRNGYARQRTVLRINFIYWDPARQWKASYEILKADALEIFPVGPVNRIQVNGNSEEPVTRRHPIESNYLEKDGGEFGVRVEVLGADGIDHETAFSIMTVKRSENGFSYECKRTNDLSLDKPREAAQLLQVRWKQYFRLSGFFDY